MNNIYNRENDFNMFRQINHDFPAQEIYYFFDEDRGNWLYELIDNISLQLSDFNKGGSRLIATSLTDQYNFEDVMNLLEDKYPDAEIMYYLSKSDWVDDYEMGCIL